MNRYGRVVKRPSRFNDYNGDKKKRKMWQVTPALVLS